ncbi:hypothetical protein [Egicoccus sp. AB-alg6-2]|uniref:hypothetical protein n=1 Tax=Egicoccus sp. AB-alg6-2 TaxID=3242692 RepID=UPI00359EB66E
MGQRTWSVLVGGALVLAACAGGGTSGSEGTGGQGIAVGEPAAGGEPGFDPDDTVNGDPDTPVSSGPVEPDAAMGDELVPTLVDPTPGMVDVAAIGWEGAQPLGDRDDAVLITWWSGVEPCHVLDHYTVLETAEQVEVTLFEGRQPPEDGGDQACIEIGRYTGVVVELDAPLDGRTVVDGTGT